MRFTRRCLSVTAVLAATVLAPSPESVAAKPIPATGQIGQNPVIYMHGYRGRASEFDAMKRSLIDSGYSSSDLIAVDFPNDTSNESNAAALSAVVDQVLQSTGASKVDLVAYSMGNLSTRYYLKNLGGASKVGHYYGISGPNHGTESATTCPPSGIACTQAAPGSSFLLALNAGDETPGDLLYATIVSQCDNVIVPFASSDLVGADNRRTAKCVSHTATPKQADVLAQIPAFFAS